MGLLESTVIFMEEAGLFRIGFPFILILSISYGLLNKAEFFEEDSVQAGASISFSFISMGAIFYFVPQGLILGATAAFAFALIGAFAFVVLTGISEEDSDEDQSDLPVKVVGVPIAMTGLIGSIIYFVPVLEFIPGVNPENVLSTLVQPVLVILVLGGIIAMFVSDSDEEEDE
jgi:predicted neutral ceramidase superfamily lipid hydrolase